MDTSTQAMYECVTAFYVSIRSQHNTVVFVTELWAGRPRNRSLVTSQDGNFTFSTVSGSLLSYHLSKSGRSWSWLMVCTGLHLKVKWTVGGQENSQEMKCELDSCSSRQGLMWLSEHGNKAKGFSKSRDRGYAILVIDIILKLHTEEVGADPSGRAV